MAWTENALYNYILFLGQNLFVNVHLIAPINYYMFFVFCLHLETVRKNCAAYHIEVVDMYAP